MPNFCAKLKKFLANGDLFSTSQFLRYKKESEFGTATGGFISIAVIIVFAALFWSQGIKTVHRELINASVSQESEAEPSFVQVVAGPEGGFNFAVALVGFDLNDPNLKYFNISLTQYNYGPLFTLINSTAVPLEQCTLAHFAINDDITAFFKRFPITMALCPPLNSQFTLGGRVTSDLYSMFTIKIEKCQQAVDSRCAPDALISAIESQIGYFTLGFPMVNTLINPGEQTYVQTYVEDRNYFYFSTTHALVGSGELSQYVVETDISLLPGSEVITEHYLAMPEQFNTKAVPVVNDVYAQISYTKAATFPVYSRSFSKVDDFFSYIGGLVSIILVLFFFVGTYSAQSLILEMASKTFLLEPGEAVPAASFNFLYYISTGIKDLLTRFGKGPSWPKVDKFRRCRDGMLDQLDISFLIQRVVFLERAIANILPEHQFKALFVRSKPTLSEIKTHKRQYKLAKLIRKCGKETPAASYSVANSFFNFNDANEESPKKACPE
jgi:hypothetical protein